VAESRRAFENRLLAAAHTAMDEIEEDLVRSTRLERAGLRSELETHVGWLYERIALKRVPKQIALEIGGIQSTVEDGILSIARLLDIQLPRNRGPSIRRAR
jgi:hypothetical protein